MGIIKMRHSIELRDGQLGYGFLSLAKNIGENIISNYSKKTCRQCYKICSRCNKNCFKKRNSKNSRSYWRFNWQ